MSNYDKIALEVMEKISPEELGALLYDATMLVVNQNDAERKYHAIKVIIEHGGKELVFPVK